mmetsp:Transcript_19285/g.59964  ORF Transcript_19285/g.59964 Transcript_19285/m.59964 type:complete len:247 (-) Transcript_19285:2531-3271(-)
MTASDAAAARPFAGDATPVVAKPTPQPPRHWPTISHATCTGPSVACGRQAASRRQTAPRSSPYASRRCERANTKWSSSLYEQRARPAPASTKKYMVPVAASSAAAPSRRCRLAIAASQSGSSVYSPLISSSSSSRSVSLTHMLQRPKRTSSRRLASPMDACHVGTRSPLPSTATLMTLRTGSRSCHSPLVSVARASLSAGTRMRATGSMSMSRRGPFSTGGGTLRRHSAMPPSSTRSSVAPDVRAA